MAGRRRGRSRRHELGAPQMGSSDPNLALRKGTARTCGAGSARPRTPGRRRRPTLAQSRAQPAHRCSPRRSRGVRDHPERRGLARAGRGGVQAGTRRRRPRVVVGGGSRLGSTRTPAARRLLPLARDGGARRGRGVTHRGGRAAPTGARRRGSHRSKPLLRELEPLPDARGSISCRQSRSPTTEGKA